MADDPKADGAPDPKRVSHAVAGALRVAADAALDTSADDPKADARAVTDSRRADAADAAAYYALADA